VTQVTRAKGSIFHRKLGSDPIPNARCEQRRDQYDILWNHFSHNTRWNLSYWRSHQMRSIRDQCVPVQPFENSFCELYGLFESILSTRQPVSFVAFQMNVDQSRQSDTRGG
jgi:hypothetical protein